MERKELDMEMLESINGGNICAGYSNKRGCNIAYLSQDTSVVYALNVPLNEWSYYCNTLAMSLPTEESIMQQALAEGKITVYQG